MANLIQGFPITNGFANGHKTSPEDTEEVLSISSASEVDSLEKDVEVPSKSFYKTLLKSAKNGGAEMKGQGKRETVIEKEIRLQKEKEEALAEERRTAQTAAFLRQRSLVDGGGLTMENNKEVAEDACDTELASTPDSGVSSEPVSPRRNIKVRPVVEDEEDGKIPTYQVTKESAVEKEIRLALQREEELKREKALQSNGSPMSPAANPDQQIVNCHSKSEIYPSFSSVNSRALDLLNPRSERSLQRKLATSRIQQEIEEQSQRELTLRAEGAIKSISEDYVDGWVLGRLKSTENLLSEPAIRSPPSLPSTPDSDLTDPGISSPEIARSSSNSSPVIVNGQQNAKFSTLNGNNSKRMFVKKSIAVATLPRPQVKGVMQKFISSRGKVVSSFTNNSRPHSSRSFSLDGDDPTFVRERLMDEIRAPPPRNMRKMYCSAQSKIQAELQQMKAREEELRLVRAKQLALSQPNLSNIGLDEDDKQADKEDNPISGMNGLMGRATSNPNLLEDSSVDDHMFKPSGERRRSALIAQWEEKIMQKNNDN